MNSLGNYARICTAPGNYARNGTARGAPFVHNRAHPSHRNGEIAVNDAIHQGPAIMPDILGLHLRAREHNCLVTADIEKAFHQIYLSESDRDACTILWLKDHNMPPARNNVIFYRYTRIPFGINASPYLLAMGVTLFLEKTKHPLKDKILRDMYVDNIQFGCKDAKECNAVCRSSMECFDELGMNLREYTCSCVETRNMLPLDRRSKEMLKSKLLGTSWNTENDTLRVPFKVPIVRGSYTKRSMLSAYSWTFDLMGLLGPLLIKFKIVISDICRAGFEWDVPVPQEYIIRWEKLIKEVETFEKDLPRCVSIDAPGVKKSLVVFCDASKVAYGTVAYVKTEMPNGECFSRLLLGKARVTPPNATIPRLELLALTIATRMIEFICREMDTTFDDIFILSDYDF